VSRIDPATDTVTATVKVGVHPGGETFDGRDLWVANYGSADLSRFRP
jgi:DNA-binding beta-propeller fold protein YncE